MPNALMLSALFVTIGVVLVRSARSAHASGVAELEEGGTLTRRRHPVRFAIFVACQWVFGVVGLVVGLALGAWFLTSSVAP